MPSAMMAVVGRGVLQPKRDAAATVKRAICGCFHRKYPERDQRARFAPAAGGCMGLSEDD